MYGAQARYNDIPGLTIQFYCSLCISLIKREFHCSRVIKMLRCVVRGFKPVEYTKMMAVFFVLCICELSRMVNV